jgi:ATP-dependent RNA helicase HelY
MNERPGEISPAKLISSLRGYNLLPAIVFLPTRRKCDEAALEVAGDRSQKTNPDKQRQRDLIFREFAETAPEILKHKHRKLVINHGVASHHAGHIPSWKLVIEKMMSSGLLNAIFATSTVAAGVDFPARTVVITNADTRGNEGWRPLTANELQQMTGRAGRRGKDNVGFAVLAPGQFQNPKRIATLLKSQPDPLQSKFRATYTSLLNLLDAFGEFAHVRDIAEKSFAFRATRHDIDVLEHEKKRRFRNIATVISDIGLPVESVLGFERLISARNSLHGRADETRATFRHEWLRDVVVPGRIVTRGRSRKRLFFVLSVRNDSVSAMRDDGTGATFSLSHVGRVHEKIYNIRDAEIEQSFYDVFEDRNEPLAEPKHSRKTGSEDAEAIINSAIDKLLPPGKSEDERRSIFQTLWAAYEDASAIEKTQRDVDFLKSEIWLPFERRAKVLDRLGYLDFHTEKVSDIGKWLADLRVDRPLLVGEALRRNVFNDIDDPVYAGLVASLAADPDRNYGDLYLSDRLLNAVNDLEDVILDVSDIELRAGVEPVEEINLSAAAAAERWAAGMDWDQLVNRTKAEEGDLVRLLSRTGEALMQIAHVKGSNEAASQSAARTADVVLREPVR